MTQNPMGPLIPSQGVSGWLPGEGLKEKWVGGGGAERQGKGRCRQKEQHIYKYMKTKRS